MANKKRKRSPVPQDTDAGDSYGSEFPACDNVGNEVLSCWPTANTNLTQGQFSRFIWNTRFPSFIGAGDVDVYLYHADSDLLVRKWTEHNAKGWVPLQVDDTWFGQRGYSFQPGHNQSYPYYFLVVPAGHIINGGEDRQPTFTAIQTGPLQAVLSSSSASAASASAAASSASSNGSLQQGNGNNNGGGGGGSFPSWAIAVLAILGVLALIALLLLSFIILRKLRNDRRKQNRVSHRSSIGSESPMMAAVNQPMSPSGAGDTVRGSYPGTGPVVVPASLRSPLYQGYDGASITSRANSAGEGIISGADAAIMADAFRKALRKPDFTEPVEEGESPDQPEEQLLNRELAEEGRDLRSVSSSRGVRVETLLHDDDPSHIATAR